LNNCPDFTTTTTTSSTTTTTTTTRTTTTTTTTTTTATTTTTNTDDAGACDYQNKMDQLCSRTINFTPEDDFYCAVATPVMVARYGFNANGVNEGWKCYSAVLETNNQQSCINRGGDRTKVGCTDPDITKPYCNRNQDLAAKIANLDLNNCPDVTEPVTNIFLLIDHAVPSMSGLMEEYGCAGLGKFDSTIKSAGKPVDFVDQALNERKHCLNCASKVFGPYSSYTYDTLSNSCANQIGTAGRSFCECDVQFVSKVNGQPLLNQNYDTTKCSSFGDGNGNGSNGKCCQSSSGLFRWYNAYKLDCCAGTVMSIGSC